MYSFESLVMCLAFLSLHQVDYLGLARLSSCVSVYDSYRKM